jgi:hypothetical protein
LTELSIEPFWAFTKKLPLRSWANALARHLDKLGLKRPAGYGSSTPPDLTRILAGPFCSMLLGDMGAEVIKVEPPGEGDPIRQQGTIVDGLSWYFAQFNRNKKSITLDLYAEEGKVILGRLLERAARPEPVGVESRRAARAAARDRGRASS